MTPDQIRSILANTDRGRIEALAREAHDLTRQYFGRAISLYTPLYLSNYCSSHCTYCGFHSHNRIERVKLDPKEIATEMAAIAATGIRNILLLTGESPQMTPLPYLKDAIMIAKKHFQGIALEVYPMTEPEYRELFLAGADGVTIYQETYDRKRYSEVHLAGQKKDYDFRRGAPERIAKAGMRQISLGVLLGLGPLAEDLAALYTHLRELEIAFPGVEYSLSFPRLRKIKSKEFVPHPVPQEGTGGTPPTGLRPLDSAKDPVDDITFTKILCLTRMLFPRVGINLSTRENADFRNHALELSVTRISVGSKTTVGGYKDPDEEGAPQFDVLDHRSAEETIRYLKDHNFDPVFTDWRRIENG